MSEVTIHEDTARLVLALLVAWERPTARAAALVKTNGEASVDRFHLVEDAIRDLKRGLYG